MKKREGINLSIDISVTNANDNDATQYNYQTNKRSENNHLHDNVHHNSKHNKNNPTSNDNNNNYGDALCNSQTTFRAEGLSIGMDYMRFEGSTFSRSLSSHHLVIERTLGRGAFSIVQLARLKRTNFDHGHDHDCDDEFGNGGGGGGGFSHDIDDPSMTPSSPSSSSQIYYALKLFPLHKHCNISPLERTQSHLVYYHDDDDDDVNHNPLGEEEEEEKKRKDHPSQPQPKQVNSMLLQELKSLSQLQCDCLVQLIGAFYEPGISVTMVLEYMDCGSLSDLIGFDSFDSHSFDDRDDRSTMTPSYQSQFGNRYNNNTNKKNNNINNNNNNEDDDNNHCPRRTMGGGMAIPNQVLAAISYQILWGLSYLHYEGLIHRDVKPANILVHSGGQVKLSDLGIASFTKKRGGEGARGIANGGDDGSLNHTVIGTTRYMSPERMLDKAYGSPSDIWSFGLVLLECATGGWSPFCDDEEEEGGKSAKCGKEPRGIVEMVMVLEDFCIHKTMKRIFLSHDSSPCLATTVSNEERTASNCGCIDMVNWNEEHAKEGGIEEMIIICLQAESEKRMPANILLQSPWFEKHGIRCVDDAVKVMQQFLKKIKTFSTQ